MHNRTSLAKSSALIPLLVLSSFTLQKFCYSRILAMKSGERFLLLEIFAHLVLEFLHSVTLDVFSAFKEVGQLEFWLGQADAQHRPRQNRHTTKAMMQLGGSLPAGN
jgi:hypothetical protein